MSPHDLRQPVLFPAFFEKPVQAVFDTSHSSSDGGAVLLHCEDQRLDLISSVAAELEDIRQSSKSHFSLEDLLRQRVLAIACGKVIDSFILKSPPGHFQETIYAPIAKDCFGRMPRKLWPE